ncbi:MAG TPA: DegT/DnrJ/EryC1/StrS family aminotransferase [Planctomycetes bacterium]|nr:DegT/DnrJ/EryC1/StrS family aminotransferase [Planctomycetota bacterium]
MSPTVSSPQTRKLAPVDLAAERAFLGSALPEAVLRVLDSGRFVLGPEVEALERAFAERCRCRAAFGVASGTDALVLGLLALGVKPGDRVLTSPFTFFATAEAIAWIGAMPCFADVEEHSGLLDVEKVEAALDDSIRCLLPVHLYGQMADMRALRALADEHGFSLLEDGAQAHGAERDGIATGELGDACTFSFYPTKNLGAAGEGGLVVTRDQAVADRLAGLRDHGSRTKYRHDFIGTNSRLHALQAAVLNVKLPHLDAWNDARRANAARYDEGLGDLESIRPMAALPGATHVYHQYTIRVLGEGRRDRLQEALAAEGIHAAVHYPIPLHLQPAAEAFGYREGDLPVAERLAGEVLCLPVHPFLTEEDVERIVDAIRRLA